MRIHIETVSPKSMRYSTCGDWQFKNGDLYIQVAEIGNRYEEACIGLHEAIEALLCELRGVTTAEVDAYDMKFEKARTADSEEPGDMKDAPYYEAHQFATQIEKLIHARLSWEQYEARVSAR